MHLVGFIIRSTNHLELMIHVTQDTEGDTFWCQMIKIPVPESRVLQNREGFNRKYNPRCDCSTVMAVLRGV